MSRLEVRSQTFKPRGTRAGTVTTVSKVPAKRMMVTTRTREVLSNIRGTNLTRSAPMMLNRRGVASKETGFVDTALANYNFDTTGSIALIATVAQGASVNQRIGKKALWKSLQARGQAFSGTVSAINDCAMLIVYDKRPTGALPAITDILVTASAGAMNNDANSGRFSILKRWDFVLLGNFTGVLATQQLTDVTAASADFFLNLKSKKVDFKAAGTGAIGDIEEGALYIVTVGSQAAGTSAAVLNIGFRTRFVDI